MPTEIMDGRLVVKYQPDAIRASIDNEWTFYRYAHRKCVRCGNPLTKDRWSDRCPLCNDCHSFTTVRYLGIYHHDRDDDLKQALVGLKYYGQPFWAKVLGMALSLIITNEPPELAERSLVVAVPNHPDDHSERDFNPPDMLARHIATYTPTIYVPDLLKKTAPNEQKSIATCRERFNEVAGKFEATTTLSGEQITIIDDVMTTGATLSTCAKCCLDAGAAEVHAVVVGRNYKFLEDREYG